MTLSDHDDATVRASDADREQAVAMLRDHLEAGRLTFDEFGERVDEAYAARTLSDVRHCLRELPPPPLTPLDRLGEHRRRRHARLSWPVSRFLFVNGLIVSIWAASGGHAFWPIWVIIPTGAILIRRIAAGEGAADDSADAAVPAAPAQRPPSDTAASRAVMTILFVDIVGSTERAAAIGDAAWRRALDDYESGVDTQLRRCGGETLFTKGDEVVAAFALPAAAVECAFGIREHAASLGLHVRAGMHAGEVERRGERASGIALHIGQRVCAHAEPGQVLMTSTVRDLLVGSAITATSVGEHELKGLPSAWHLYQAVR